MGPTTRLMAEHADVEPHLRTEGERQELLPLLEALADKLCQTTPFIIGALRDAGLTVVPLDPSAREISPVRENLEAAPTKDELEAAYRMLFDAKVAMICDLSLGAIADIVGGSPPHAPTRWSPAEIRLARAVLILGAACLPPAGMTQESIDPGNPVLQAADAFNRSRLANYGATGTATLAEVKPDAE